jgi:hypothetical protein
MTTQGLSVARDGVDGHCNQAVTDFGARRVLDFDSLPAWCCNVEPITV